MARTIGSNGCKTYASQQRHGVLEWLPSQLLRIAAVAPSENDTALGDYQPIWPDQGVVSLAGSLDRAPIRHREPSQVVL